MKKIFILIVTAILASNAAVSYAAERSVSVNPRNVDTQRRIALVIGNSMYKVSPLKNPANDAAIMAKTLRGFGFAVDERINLGMKEMEQAIEAFGHKIKQGGVGLFYYAGHGMQVNGENYLLPVDANIEGEAEVRYKAVNAGLVLAKMDMANNGMNIVILDACRNNPFARSFRSSNTGLATMDAPSGTIIAYATSPGKVASDGSGANGLYTSLLVRSMQKPGTKIEDVFKQVRTSVRQETGGEQIPWESSSLEGDFYFKLPKEGKTIVAEETPEPQPDKEPSAPAPTAPGITVKKAIKKKKSVQVAQAEIQEQPAATPSRSDTYIDPATGMEFVLVKGGCFQMGDTFGDGDSDEMPAHEVCVDDYYIGKYEVTQGQWRNIRGNNPSRFSYCGDNCPVDQVSWNDIQDYIRILNQRTGKNYRLPTEAEWEYAARSGGKSEKYSGGNDLDSVAWYDSNSGDQTHQVGQKQPNGLGIYDMSGNVWEWCQDWYSDSYYKSSPRNNPQGPSSERDRVLRGGSWYSSAAGTRATYRFRYNPDYWNYYFGFRLARTK